MESDLFVPYFVFWQHNLTFKSSALMFVSLVIFTTYCSQCQLHFIVKLPDIKLVWLLQLTQSVFIVLHPCPSDPSNYKWHVLTKWLCNLSSFIFPVCTDSIREIRLKTYISTMFNSRHHIKNYTTFENIEFDCIFKWFH